MKGMSLRAAMALAAETAIEAGESGDRPRAAARVLAQAIEEVRRIHSPKPDSNPRYLECGGCGLDGSEEPYGWPCDTAKAVGINPRVEVTVRWDG